MGDGREEKGQVGKPRLNGGGTGLGTGTGVQGYLLSCHWCGVSCARAPLRLGSRRPSVGGEAFRAPPIIIRFAFAPPPR